MLELSLTRLFSATMYYHFAFMAISLAVSRFAGDINRLYLFDLTGAALGCLLLIPLLNFVGAINIIIIVGITASLAGICFALPQKRSIAFVIAAGCLVGLVFLGLYNSKTKVLNIYSSKGSEESGVLFSKWNSFSRITVQEDSDSNLQIKIDSDAATTIVPDGRNTALHEDQRNNISAIAYHIKRQPKTLIIGPGGGLDVSAALVFGASRITAVEINPIIARDVMLTEPFRSYSGDIYSDPRVVLEVDE